MLQQTRSIQVVVLRPIGDGAANGGAGEEAVVQALPLHGERGQLPIGCPRDAGAVSIGPLMTRRTRERRNAVALRSAYDIEQVAMAVIALLGRAGGGMAIDAAGM